MNRRISLAVGVVAGVAAAIAAGLLLQPDVPRDGDAAADESGASGFNRSTDWRENPIWHQGKAEWAVYDARREIYGESRRYEATIFTNRQHMDPQTTVKAADWRQPGAIEVFKHNVSEIIPTEHYDYRFLTTSFIRARDLRPYKLVASTQEDCGSTYHQFIVGDRAVECIEFSYFPGEGGSELSWQRPADLAFHDMLTLTLRDFDFENESVGDKGSFPLVADQTDTHAAPQKPERASLRFDGIEQINVPHGTIECFHLTVTHQERGGTRTSDYWFATEPDLHRVLVRYEGPYGVSYELKKYGWWAYWDRTQPAPM